MDDTLEVALLEAVEEYEQDTTLMADEATQEEDEEVSLSETSRESSTEQEVYKKGCNSYTFTCSKCNCVVTISSDLYPRIEDKKAQHKCRKVEPPQ